MRVGGSLSVLLIILAMSGLSCGSNSYANDTLPANTTGILEGTASSETNTVSTTSTKSSSWVGTAIGLVLAVICLIILLGGAGYLFFGSQRQFQRDLFCEQITINREPHDALRQLVDEEGALDLKDLNRETAKIEAMQKKRKLGRPSTEMLRYLHKIPDEDKEKAEEKRGGMATVPDCRVPKLLMRRDTQVPIKDDPMGRVRLHMNQMLDYYGNTLLLCQAPTPQQFSDQWMVIWQEGIGTVVWVGPLKEKGKVKIDPYISLDKGGTLVCGPFSTHTVWQTEGDLAEYRGYKVTVRRGQESRMLFFVHLHSWPDDQIPSQLEIDKLGMAVGFVRTQQRVQGKMEQPLAGLMVHCSMGVERSAAFMAVYIGNQMWLDTRHVNVLGILRFIRRHRYKAFGMGEPDVQVRLVFLILQSIANYYKDPGVCPIQLPKRKKETSGPLSGKGNPSSKSPRSPSSKSIGTPLSPIVEIV